MCRDIFSKPLATWNKERQINSSGRTLSLSDSRLAPLERITAKARAARDVPMFVTYQMCLLHFIEHKCVQSILGSHLGCWRVLGSRKRS